MNPTAQSTNTIRNLPDTFNGTNDAPGENGSRTAR